jgi:multiple sugar transport system substrate-binding protein
MKRSITRRRLLATGVGTAEALLAIGVLAACGSATSSITAVAGPTTQASVVTTTAVPTSTASVSSASAPASIAATTGSTSASVTTTTLTSTVTSSTSTTVAARPVAAAGSGAACSQPMDMLSTWTAGDSTGKGLLKVALEWQGMHPSCGVSFTGQASTSQAIDERLVTLIAGGTPPALVTAIGNNVGNWVARGLIADVDAQFKQDGLTGSDFVPPIWEIMNWQGKVRLVPLMMDANFPLFWNQDVVREVGLDPAKGPTTVDELDQAGQKLNKITGSEIDRLAFVPWDWYGLQNAILTAGLMFGGSFFDTAKQQLTFNDPNVVRGLEWIAGWAQRLNWQQVTKFVKGTDWPTQLAIGKLAYAPLVSANVPVVRQKNPAAKIAFGPLPAAAPGKPGIVWTGCWSIATVPGSKRLDDAWSFMHYIGASPDGTLAVAKDIGGLPGYIKSPGFDYLAKDPLTAAHVEAAKRAQFLRPEFYTQTVLDYTPLNAVLDGKTTAQTALNDFNSVAQQKFDQARAQQPKA